MRRERRDSASPRQVIAEHGHTSDVCVIRKHHSTVRVSSPCWVYTMGQTAMTEIRRPVGCASIRPEMAISRICRAPGKGRPDQTCWPRPHT
jgi:hypothetical protein